MGMLMPFLVSHLVLVTAISVTDILPQGKRWWVPDKDYHFSWVNRETADDELKSLQDGQDKITYHLYTKMNPDDDQQLWLSDPEALTASNFNGGDPTRIIIHGFQSNYKLLVCTTIRDAFLRIGSYNIICVDWSPLSSGSYVIATFRVPVVGESVGLFVEFLTLFGGMQLKDLTIIGHSLGAHVAGFTGKFFQTQQVGHIVGLDTALPLYRFSDCSSRLCKTDAKYVESIHTCGGKLGFLKPIGDPAFYPNGGKKQPGCGWDLTGSCAHSRSYMYYAEATEKDNFPTIGCSSYGDAVANKCGTSYSGVKMTSPYGQKVNGTFYVPVNSEPNFGKG